jgi:hypothetical protein
MGVSLHKVETGGGNFASQNRHLKRNSTMDIKKSDERYYSVKVMSSLPLSEQLHEANAVLCTEASEDESAFLERSETENGHIVLLYRLWRRKNGKGRNKELL